MTAAERFKKRYADQVEYICVLEEQLEAAQKELQKIKEEVERRLLEEAGISSDE